MKREVLPARKAQPKPLLVDPVFIAVVGVGFIVNATQFVAWVLAQ